VVNLEKSPSKGPVPDMRKQETARNGEGIVEKREEKQKDPCRSGSGREGKKLACVARKSVKFKAKRAQVETNTANGPAMKMGRPEGWRV